MTGYASTSSEAPGRAQTAGSAHSGIDVEIRSVNGRFLDASFRLADELRSLEPALRDLLGTRLRRGKVELRMAPRRAADTAWPQPQPEQLNRLAQLESMVQGWLPGAPPLSVQEVLQWCRNASAPDRLDETALEAARSCLDDLCGAREREGARLVAVLMERISRLRELALQAAPMVPAVVARQQQRFLERWNAALETSGAAQSIPRESLQERALNEAAAYAIRIDVSEELSRLTAHLDEIERLLGAGGEIGKRLDFLIQELHREANTLGSKSAALELTSVSVEMKVAIEQMREQVQNLE